MCCRYLKSLINSIMCHIFYVSKKACPVNCAMAKNLVPLWFRIGFARSRDLFHCVNGTQHRERKTPHEKCRLLRRRRVRRIGDLDTGHHIYTARPRNTVYSIKVRSRPNQNETRKKPICDRRKRIFPGYSIRSSMQYAILVRENLMSMFVYGALMLYTSGKNHSN